MPAINPTDLANAKVDVDTIAGIANSQSETVTDRLGRVRQTLQGVLNFMTTRANSLLASLSSVTSGLSAQAQQVYASFSSQFQALLDGVGYQPPELYGSGINLTSQTQTVSYLGNVYGPNPGTVPFTTSGTFETAKFRLLTGVTGVVLGADNGGALVGLDGSDLRSDALSRIFARAIDMDGTAACAIAPRTTAFGTGPYTVGVMLTVNSFANQPGVFGSLSGGLGLRFDTTGHLRASCVNVAETAVSTNAAIAGQRVLAMYSNNGAGSATISLNAVSGGTVADSQNYSGEGAFLGSPDGINSPLAGSIAYAFVSNQALSLTDARQILDRGLSATQIADCQYVMGDPRSGGSLVVPPAQGSVRTTILPPAGASVRGFPYAVPAVSAIPRSGIYWPFGDSQTFCFNASGSPVYTDTTAQRSLISYRWTDILAKTNNRDLTVINMGVTGSGLQFVPDQPTSADYAWRPHFYVVGGALAPDWVGMINLMLGWNNLEGSTPASAERMRMFKRGVEACIARAVVQYYGGVGVEGWYQEYGVVVGGWATTGTAQTLTPPDAACNPFPLFGAPTNVAIRKLLLAPGQYVEFTILDVGLNGKYLAFTEASADGAPYVLKINGTVVISDTCVTSEDGIRPQCLLLENPPIGATCRIENTGSTGTVRWLGAGWLVGDASVIVDRTIVVCSTSGNPTGRTDANLQLAAKQTRAAAQMFADNGVLFADVTASWQSGDNDAQDPAHISPQGNLRIAMAVAAAVPVPKVLPNYAKRF